MQLTTSSNSRNHIVKSPKAPRIRRFLGSSQHHLITVNGGICCARQPVKRNGGKITIVYFSDQIIQVDKHLLRPTVRRFRVAPLAPASLFGEARNNPRLSADIGCWQSSRYGRQVDIERPNRSGSPFIRYYCPKRIMSGSDSHSYRVILSDKY